MEGDNTFLNSQGATEKIKEEFKKYLETKDNEKTQTQSLWDAEDCDWFALLYGRNPHNIVKQFSTN